MAQFVMDGQKVLARYLDAHLQPHIAQHVDVPRAGMAHHLPVPGLQKQRTLQNVCGSGSNPSDTKKFSPYFTICFQSVLRFLSQRRQIVARIGVGRRHQADRCCPTPAAHMLPSRSAGIGPLAGTASPYFCLSLART